MRLKYKLFYSRTIFGSFFRGLLRRVAIYRHLFPIPLAVLPPFSAPVLLPASPKTLKISFDASTAPTHARALARGRTYLLPSTIHYKMNSLEDGKINRAVRTTEIEQNRQSACPTGSGRKWILERRTRMRWQWHQRSQQLQQQS
jgi:hypothetical protein